jgi:hypothetical protein
MQQAVTVDQNSHQSHARKLIAPSLNGNGNFQAEPSRRPSARATVPTDTSPIPVDLRRSVVEQLEENFHFSPRVSAAWLAHGQAT